MTVPLDQPSRFSATRLCAIGLDVGGTKIAGGVVSASSGRVLVRRMISTQAGREGIAILRDALWLAEALGKEASTLGLAVAGIGVGVAELVDLEGNVTSGHTIQWRGLPVRESFAQLAPAVIESDVRAAAQAESLFGAGRSFKIFVYVTVGTGISCSLVQEGRPFPGARGNALIFSSSPLTTTCTSCGAVSRPILEEFASGPALVRRYNQHCTAQIQSGEGVLLAVKSGDPVATDVVRTAGEALGVSVAFLVNVLDPQAVIVGGGLGLAGGLYWSSFTRSAREHIWAEADRDLPILPAALGTEAGLIGAAARVLQRRESSLCPE
jgi:glucokinase